ncbi:MAG: type II toxin-antitoxin system RelE/ParE family toxin [Ktedonobacterales bacterium]
MTWKIEYFERPDGTQPAELFEDELARQHPKLLGKLLRALDALADHGPQAGGGLVEACHGYPGLWEVRVIFAQTLARDLFGFDGATAVLVHGYVKRAGMPASPSDLKRAAAFWHEYLRTRHVSSELPANADQGTSLQG